MSLGLDWATLPDDQAEESIFHYIRSYDEAMRIGWAKIGIMARTVHDKMLWRHRVIPETGVACVSMPEWIHCAAPSNPSTIYRAWEDAKALTDIPDEYLSQVRQSNMWTLRSLSTSVRADVAVLEAARAKTTVLEDFIDLHYPDQHIPRRGDMRFAPPKDVIPKIKEAIDKAMERGAGNRDDALEYMADAALELWAWEDSLKFSIAEKGTYAEDTEAAQ